MCYGFPLVIREHLAAYLSQYVQILGATSDNRNSGWGFVIMLDNSAFQMFVIENASHRDIRKSTCW